MSRLTPLPADSPTISKGVLATLAGRPQPLDLYAGPAGEMYDDIAACDQHEVAEIVASVRRTQGPVLELAAGGGRLTLALVRLGRPVTALDHSDDMLDLLRAKLRVLPERIRNRCSVVHGDMGHLNRVQLTPPFGAVVLGTTSITLLDAPQRARLFEAVATLLTEEGRLLLTVLDDASVGVRVEMEVVGKSGRRYTLRDQSATTVDGCPARTVTVVPIEQPTSGPVPVGVSTVRILEIGSVVAEIESAGLVVRGTTRVPSPSRFTSVLVEASR